MDLKCPAGGTLDSSACTCTFSDRDGNSVTLDARCPRDYAVDSSCATCELSSEKQCEKIKCPKGQGWNTDNCACEALPECTIDQLDAKCRPGTKFNPMTCGCERSNDKGKEDRGKFVNDIMDSVTEWEEKYDNHKNPEGQDGEDSTTDGGERPPPGDGTNGGIDEEGDTP